ncbi:MAG: undecaprenyldiphospho-muramoylpentapeptide beta-N-acetylglucosaminyltransferase [Bdellovibrionales bacterium]
MRILIAGGGTGGHIYPALSIAKAVMQMDSKAAVEFVGTQAGLESQLVPKENFKIHFIPIGRLNKNVSLKERFKTLLQLPYAIFLSFVRVIQFKPDIVLGVGGYASGPLVFAAAMLKKTTLIWEPNAYPGLANRILSKYVTLCLVVFKEAAQFLKNKNIVQAHMPIRKEIENFKPTVQRTANFRIVVFGGSQGARPINQAMMRMVQMNLSWLSGVEIVHQTGPLDFESVQTEYKKRNIQSSQIEAHAYLYNMSERYAWADLIISRAGTGTISELAACGKAAILIPLPSAADDHQTKNALALSSMNGAVLLPQSELTPERLIKEIQKFKDNPKEVSKLEENIKKFHKPHAAEEIAKLIFKMVESKATQS